ncbi:MAG: hypothetical protein ACKO1L_09000 [Brachymonas sp.]
MKILDRIVALFETGWSASPLRRQFACAAALLLVMTGWPVWFALAEPSLGLRFVRMSNEALTIEPSYFQTRLPPGWVSGLKLQEAHIGSAKRLQITPQELLETAGMETCYERQNAYHARHREIWQALQQEHVTVHVQGQSFEIQPRPKSLLELDMRFWWPWALSSLSLAVALAVWLFSPNRRIAGWHLISATSFAYIMGVVASSSTRLLSLPPSWEFLLKATHLTGYLQSIGFCMILWHFPKALGSVQATRRLIFALFAWVAVWLTIDWFEWVDTIAVGFRLPMVAAGLVYITLFTLQWRQARDQPLQRSQLKWLMLLFGLAFSAVLIAYAYAIQTDVRIDLPQAYGFSWMAMIYVGLIPLATRLKMFALEAWWARAWAWLLGGLLVVAVDVALLLIFRISSHQALLMSMALAGWVYFPLRQWLWEQLLGNQRKRVQDFLPQVVQLVSLSQQSGG